VSLSIVSKLINGPIPSSFSTEVSIENGAFGAGVDLSDLVIGNWGNWSAKVSAISFQERTSEQANKLVNGVN